VEFFDHTLRPYEPRRWDRSGAARTSTRRRTGVFAGFTAVLVATLIASGALFWTAVSGTANQPEPFVALYEHADGSRTPLAALTCQGLAADLRALGTPVSGSGKDWGPAGFGRPYAVRNDVAAVAALPKGGVRQHLLTCDGRARWSSIESRKVRIRVDVYGGLARASDATITTRRR
jgi:hypothetical protein